MMLEYAAWVTQALLAVAAFCAVYRVFRGPSVLDRVISVDVILIVVASMLIVDMVLGDHQDFILFVVVTAVIGFLGAVAIARYVVGRRPEDAARDVERGRARATGRSLQEAVQRAQAAEPEAPRSSLAVPSPETAEAGEAQGRTEDESTSWFTALARSGFVPKQRSEGQPAQRPEAQPDVEQDVEHDTEQKTDGEGER